MTPGASVVGTPATTGVNTNKFANVGSAKTKTVARTTNKVGGHNTVHLAASDTRVAPT